MFSLADEEGTNVLACVGKSEAAVAWKLQGNVFVESRDWGLTNRVGANPAEPPSLG